MSREIPPLDSAVLTVGALEAGTKENIIPDNATIQLDVQTHDEDVQVLPPTLQTRHEAMLSAAAAWLCPAHP